MPGGFVLGAGLVWSIRAFAQSPEHNTFSTVNGPEKGSPGSPYSRCVADFKTSAVADEQGDADSLVATGAATDWPVVATSWETRPPQAVTEATAAAQSAAYLIRSTAVHSSFGPAEQQ